MGCTNSERCKGNPLLEENESLGLSGLSGGLSLPADVAAAAPLLGFAVGIALVQGLFLGQRWPSATGVHVTAAGDSDTSDGLNARKRL